MNRITREEHAHVVALVGGGAGDEQGECGPGWILGTSGGMYEQLHGTTLLAPQTAGQPGPGASWTAQVDAVRCG